MKVSILIATAGRPLFSDMMDSLCSSTNWTRANIDLEVVIVMDGEQGAKIVADSLKKHLDHIEGILNYSPTKRGALWAWNLALQLSSGDVLVPAGDDQLFHGNWLDYALESHREKLGGYGVVGMNDLAYNGNTQVATMWLFDRKYCKDVMGGIFAPPMYHYYCIDMEWWEKARTLGRYYWDERSIVEHLHSAHGKRPLDDLDREKMDAGWMEEDNKTFAERKAAGFPVTWNPII